MNQLYKLDIFKQALQDDEFRRRLDALGTKWDGLSSVPVMMSEKGLTAGIYLESDTGSHAMDNEESGGGAEAATAAAEDAGSALSREKTLPNSPWPGQFTNAAHRVSSTFGTIFGAVPPEPPAQQTSSRRPRRGAAYGVPGPGEKPVEAATSIGHFRRLPPKPPAESKGDDDDPDLGGGGRRKSKKNRKRKSNKKRKKTRKLVKRVTKRRKKFNRKRRNSRRRKKLQKNKRKNKKTRKK